MNYIIVAVIVNVVYLAIWIGINKMRESNNSIIRKWDNGHVFYESLNETDKEIYWKQDTHILNVFFSVLLLVVEGTLFLVICDNPKWLIALIIGLILSCAMGLFMSIALKKKFR